MRLCRRGARAPVIIFATAMLVVMTVSGLFAEQPAAPEGGGQAGRDRTRPASVCEPSVLDSPYVPVDSWIYPAVLRLYGLGFVDEVFLGMRPYTRASLSNMLDEAGAKIQDADPGPATDQA